MAVRENIYSQFLPSVKACRFEPQGLSAGGTKGDQESEPKYLPHRRNAEGEREINAEDLRRLIVLIGPNPAGFEKRREEAGSDREQRQRPGIRSQPIAVQYAPADEPEEYSAHQVLFRVDVRRQQVMNDCQSRDRVDSFCREMVGFARGRVGCAAEMWLNLPLCG